MKKEENIKKEILDNLKKIHDIEYLKLIKVVFSKPIAFLLYMNIRYNLYSDNINRY